jgi:hypothetical protein
VESASYAFGAPLTGINSDTAVYIRDAPPPPPGEPVSAGYAQVSPGYFATMKTALLQGRDFADRDNTNTTPVVIDCGGVARLLAASAPRYAGGPDVGAAL